MEEQILSIIEDSVFAPEGENIQRVAAKEITSHIMEFIEWIRQYCYFDDYGDLMINDNTLPEVSLPTEELYQYWLNNVKK